MYINYVLGKQSLLTVQAQKTRLLVCLSLDPKGVKAWDDRVMRDLTGLGHWGMGDTCFYLSAPEQLDALRGLGRRGARRAPGAWLDARAPKLETPPPPMTGPT